MIATHADDPPLRWTHGRAACACDPARKQCSGSSDARVNAYPHLPLLLRPLRWQRCRAALRRGVRGRPASFLSGYPSRPNLASRQRRSGWCVVGIVTRRRVWLWPATRGPVRHSLAVWEPFAGSRCRATLRRPESGFPGSASAFPVRFGIFRARRRLPPPSMRNLKKPSFLPSPFGIRRTDH